MCPHTSTRLLWPGYQYHYRTIQTKYTEQVLQLKYSSHCSTRIIHNKLAQIMSIWYETSQPVALSQGRHHTYTRHSKTPHSVVNAVECSRQRPFILTRTESTKTASMQAVAAALLPSATRSECGCNADSFCIWITTYLTMGGAHSNHISLSRLASQVHSLHN